MNVWIDGVEYMPKPKDNPPASPACHANLPWACDGLGNIKTPCGNFVDVYDKANRAFVLRAVNNYADLVNFVFVAGLCHKNKRIAKAAKQLLDCVFAS